MRRLLLFLVLVSFCFSTYHDPPISAVTFHNILKDLSDSFDESIAENDSIYFRWYWKKLDINASMGIAGLSLLIDNSTAAGKDVRVIVEEGGMMEHLLRKGSMSLRCDDEFYRNYGDSNDECDFDGDGCTEYEESTDIFYTIEINFTFRNVSEIARADETNENILGVLFKSALTNKVSIPENIEKAMANSSGNENLTVIFNGTATFVYAIDNRSSGGTHCISNKGVVYKTLYFSDNKTYPVQGRSILLFTVAPVLNEQWFRNNHFDNIVLSQNRIYKAGIYRNGGKQINFTLYEFNITEDSFGLQRIESIPVDDSEYVGEINATPVYLDNETHTYGFLYQFNYSYDGMGENELELVVNDFFGGNKSIKQKIISKQLSYGGNKTETGDEYDPATTRRSVKFGTDEIRLVEIGVGMLGLVLIILLIYKIKE